MGQKVHPIGMRVGVIRDWESRWYAEKDFSKFLNEDIKIREYLFKELKAAYISRVEIERSKNRVEIIIRSARPGVVIGTNGDNINKIKAGIEKISEGNQIHIKVLEIANPDLDAHLVARSIAEQLENRASFRSTQKKTIQKTMRSGAKGIKTLVSGRLGGAEIARSEGYAEGIVPLHTLRSDIDYASYEAVTTYGQLGVKVWICRGEVLPGQMVQEPEAPKSNFKGQATRRRRRPNQNPRERQGQQTAPRQESAPEAPKTTEGNDTSAQGGN
ncbi:MAG: 30S ribosomal protein S3 [Erysipelothrix sp.]|nr:30S ribosomal protein S3 [Erysipelothrix sp.]